MSERWTITVDRVKCVGNATCVRMAGGVFRLDADGKADPYDPEGADETTILDAAESCPAAAILVLDAETGEDLLG